MQFCCESALFKETLNIRLTDVVRHLHVEYRSYDLNKLRSYKHHHKTRSNNECKFKNIYLASNSELTFENYSFDSIYDMDEREKKNDSAANSTSNIFDKW